MATNYPTSLDTFTAHLTNDTIAASHVNNLQDAMAAVQATLGVHPQVVITPTGAADDTTYVQNAINSSVAGSTVVFDGICPISAPIVYPSYRRYVGLGVATAGATGGSGLQQKAGANITGTGRTGMLIPSAWSANTTTVDNPVIFENLYLDGNRANNGSSNACGIVLCNFWSRIVGCNIVNAPLDGIHLTDVTANNTSVLTNSASENRILWNRIENAGNDGIRQICSNGISNLDGFCAHNIISTSQVDGINFNRAAGWLFDRNHLYSTHSNGIWLDACFGTIATHNYVEDFGTTAASGIFYDGIRLQILNGWGSHIASNFVSCTEPSSLPAAYYYYNVIAGSSQTDAHAIITGNHAKAPASPTSKGTGLILQTASGGNLRVRKGANRIVGMNTLVDTTDTGLYIYDEDSRGREHLTSNAAATVAAGANAGTTPPTPTLAAGSGDLAGTVSFGTGTTPALGAMATVTFQQPFAAAPVVDLTHGNAASAGLGQLWTTPSTTAFTINTTGAPAASQAATTYKVQYRVTG